ncbi:MULTISPECIES: helix-turn-helix transcriptional regulator [unclassified Clostridium]|uniref:helix-turn-helix transcriptional regulator n=1 Tax=unclassified Clostridium TaxID=2614128 RepID=UPI00029839ED|nr:MULTISPECIES: helix-turn-helix transcriptional regulator [unclassified Clostridium]EKQ56203.1 MAG: putative transcriptional regulator [Clostridium sp. Maddingley MBC34-26]
MTLGEKIKLHRTKLNLSQEELANKCELSRNAIYNYENGKRTPTISTLEIIAHNLNLYISDLLEDSDNTHYSNKLGILNAIDKDVENNILAVEEKRVFFEQEMDELDKKYFFDLFNRKTSRMSPHEYFKFILSICPFSESDHISEEDMEELSVLFYRLVTLKAYERDSLNEMEKMIPGQSKKYEKNRFVTTCTK